MCLHEFTKETGEQNHICTVPAPSASPPRSDAPRPEMCLSLQHGRLLACFAVMVAPGQPLPFRYLLVCLLNPLIKLTLIKGRSLQKIIFQHT